MASPEAQTLGLSELAPCKCGCKKQVPRGDEEQLGHHSRKQARFAVADRGYDSPCHIWLLAKAQNGYGFERVPTRPMTYAHRTAFERARGPIPAGMQIDHLCRVRECVNPDHLEIVTQKENVRRGKSTKLTVANVRSIRSSDEKHQVLAERHGVSASHISRVKRCLVWADVLP